MNYVLAPITFILVGISLLVTYSITTLVGLCLGLGGILNYPILWLLGKINGRQRIQRKIK